MLNACPFDPARESVEKMSLFFLGTPMSDIRAFLLDRKYDAREASNGSYGLVRGDERVNARKLLNRSDGLGTFIVSLVRDGDDDALKMSLFFFGIPVQDTCSNRAMNGTKRSKFMFWKKIGLTGVEYTT